MTFRKILLLLAALLLQHGAAVASEADTLTVRIKSMRCGDCVRKVKAAVRQEHGIQAVDCNLERRTATIVYDAALTSADSIQSRLFATGRFKPSPYAPTDTIMRGFGLRIDDMFCQNCVNRATKCLNQVAGVDSIGPHLDKHYIFIRYDANVTSKADIKQSLVGVGFTPVNYYTSPKVAFAYFNIPAEAAVAENAEKVLELLEVDDATVNPRKKTLAVTYFCEEISADRLLEEIRNMGIDATVPPAHVCKESQQAQ